MKTEAHGTQPTRSGSAMVAYLVLMLVAVSTIAGLGAFVAQSTNATKRRGDMITAIQYAQGGAVIACSEMSSAVTNKSGNLNSRLVNLGYVKISGSNSPDATYQRTIASPFTNQTVTAQIWLPSESTPTSARIVATATTGKVTQTVTVNTKMSWAYPAAIISTSPGTKNGSLTKDIDSGNVVVNGDKAGPIIVDGGAGLAILANGYVNIDATFAKIPAGAISGTNFGTANEIPDYTAQGTANTLFDFGRYTAIADLTTNALNPRGNNHFTNLATFFTATKRAFTNANPAARYLEGVIVVDIAGKDPNLGNLESKTLPNGINVKGTLFFNFDSSFGASSKVINTADMNINPADLTGFVATNSATYTSGYPPVYYDWTKNPTNINITSAGYANVAPGEDMPALLYSIGILDIHGNANICGVMYTPSFVEIENKADYQIQYIKGSIIMGLGMYFENNKKSSSVISFDANTLDSLGTLSSAGKQLKVAYWQ